jgi:hypothetical protein
MTSQRTETHPPNDSIVGPALVTSQFIDWYHEGESRTVEVNGLHIVVRFVGRKGRRARIAITAPAGVVFS